MRGETAKSIKLSLIPGVDHTSFDKNSWILTFTPTRHHRSGCRELGLWSDILTSLAVKHAADISRAVAGYSDLWCSVSGYILPSPRQPTSNKTLRRLRACFLSV